MSSPQLAVLPYPTKRNDAHQIYYYLSIIPIDTTVAIKLSSFGAPFCELAQVYHELLFI